MIRIEYALSRENVPAIKESVANYMLVKLFPTTGAEAPSLPLNISLVIDNSGSMYGEDQRIAHAIDAACYVVDMLGPRDIVSVVAFHSHARTFQRSTSVKNKEGIKRVIRSITSWESGGTNMMTGMKNACSEIQRNLSSERVNRVLLLTDGNTEAPYECERIAERETRRGIVFSTFGVGDDWNQPLLAKIADLGRGRWYYIDTPTKIPDIFQQELAGLQKIFLNNVVLTAALKRGITVKKVRLVEPEIADVVTREVSEREVVVKIGTMQRDEPVFLLFQLSLAARQPGQYRIADVFAMYDAPDQADQRARTEPVSVFVTYTTDSSQLWQNGDVLRYVDMEQVDALVKRGTKLAELGQKVKATKLLAAAERIADRTGDKKKTRLIQKALQELGTAGRIDRRTRLAMADRARKTKLMPEDEVED
jgi:Ca-activated chloride channel family protein